MPAFARTPTPDLSTETDEEVDVGTDLEEESTPSSSLAFSSSDISVDDGDDTDPSGTYTVQSGDTLWGIAESALGDGSKFELLASINGIPEPYVIEPGQELKLSGPPMSVPTSAPTVSGTTDLASDGGLTEATEDLGRIQAMDGGFYDSAGALVDAIAPNPGQKGKLDLAISVPVDASGTVVATFTFKANVERSDKGVKVGFNVGGEVKAAVKQDLWVATVEAFAKAGVNGFIESFADTGAGAFRLMGLAIRDRIAGASETVADALFDKDYIDLTIEEMDEDDYVESGITASASAGVSGSVSGEIDGPRDTTLGGEVGASGDAKASVTSKTRLTKGEDGTLQRESTTDSTASASASVKAKASLSGDVNGFAVKGELGFEGSLSTGGGASGKLKAGLSGTADLDGDELNEMFTDVAYITDTLTSLGGLVETAQTALPEGDTQRMAASMSQALIDASGTGLQLDQDTLDAAKQLEGTKVKIQYQLSLEGSIDDKLKTALELKLEKTNKVTFDSGLRQAKVKILVENIQSVFSIKI